METINFEGLGLSFNINRVAIDFNGCKIYWYAIIIVIAFIVAILFLKHDDKKYDIEFEKIFTLILFVIPISIICARIYFVLFKLEDYIQNPLEIFNIKNGGLAIYGGIIGGFFTVLVYCIKNKIKLLDMLDYIAPYLPLGQAIGRWGNFFNSEAHGIETTSLFRMGIVENGKYIQVHPTFLYESVCNFLIFLILFSMKDNRKYPGQLTYLYFVLYGIIRAVIEGLRTDSLMLGDLRISQILSLVLAGIFLIVMIVKRFKKNETKNENN